MPDKGKVEGVRGSDLGKTGKGTNGAVRANDTGMTPECTVSEFNKSGDLVA